MEIADKSASLNAEHDDSAGTKQDSDKQNTSTNLMTTDCNLCYLSFRPLMSTIIDVPHR